jgi:tRNA A-37 threonylcarbamoyl transferase component Bud32
MRAVTKNGISWFLDNGPELERVIGKLTEDDTTRRSYRIEECGGGKVFVKYFLERGAVGYVRNRLSARGRKEYIIGRRLLAQGVVTPRPLAYGIGAKGSFVVQKWVEARTFKSVFDQERDRVYLLDGLARLLKQLRAHRITHNDLHLENIIVSGGAVQLIDLHKTKIGLYFSRRNEITNLTHALTMIYSQMTEEEKRRFFSEYGRPAVRPRTERGLDALWKRWVRNKKKRAFSSTSKLLKQKGAIYVRGQEEQAKGALQDFLKQDTKVRVARYDDHVRKIFTSGRRLKKAWENHVVLEYLGSSAVPRPFYMLEPRSGETGYIAMEDLQGQGEELDRFLDRYYDAMDGSVRRSFIERLARFLARLFRQGVMHRDMKACNIFVVADGFRLLDLEDILFCAPREVNLPRMVLQLNTTVPARIATADRMRFFLRLTEDFPVEKKRLFRDIARSSTGCDVVYEGVSGLKRESWQARPSGSRSPFSRQQ